MTTPTYDTPNIKAESTVASITSISSADYALKVIFSQFEHMADAKMSYILNMGVVIIIIIKKKSECNKNKLKKLFQ